MRISDLTAMEPTIGVLALGSLVAGSFFYCAYRAIYNVYFHPLRNFPGPLLCRATPIYRHYKFLRGDLIFAMKTLHDTYGPVVRTTPNELSFISPQAWKDIYMPLPGAKGGGDMVRYDRFYQFTGPNAPETLISLDKGYHTFLKRQMAPAFSERALREQEPVLREYVDLLVRRLGEETRGGETPVDLRAWFNYYTFDVIGNLGFGSDFNGLESARYHPWVGAVSQNVRELSYLQVPMYLGFQHVVHMIANSSLLKGKLLHEDLTRKKLEARLKQEKDRADLLEPFLKLEEQTFEQLLANTTTLITSGSESSSTLLVATVSLLADNPSAMRKVTDEIRSAFQSEEEITLTALNGLPYLMACLNEALRRFPPVPPGLPRVVPKGGATIAGHFVSEDTVVSVASWASYHSEEHFADPFGYHPERFMKDSRFIHDRFDGFQPFGLGHASCPGRNFAFAETRLALVKILYNFDVEGLPGTSGWASQQKAYLLWDKKPFWASLKPIR